MFEFYDEGSRVSPHQLNGLLLVAAKQLEDAENAFGIQTPSGSAEYFFDLNKGVQVWLVKAFRHPHGYLTYGQLHEMITGLQVYMVLGDRPKSLRFHLYYGPRKIVLGHGGVGTLRPTTSIADS